MPVSPEYLKLLDDMKDLHERKSRGYAGHTNDPWSNLRQCEAFGITTEQGILTRLSDKWSRLQSLWSNPDNDQVGEPLEETALDMASYLLIWVTIRREQAAKKQMCVVDDPNSLLTDDELDAINCRRKTT